MTDERLGICCGHAESAHENGKRCGVSALLGTVAVLCGCKKLRLPKAPSMQIDLASAMVLGDHP